MWHDDTKNPNVCSAVISVRFAVPLCGNRSDFPGSLCVVDCDGLWLPQDSFRPVSGFYDTSVMEICCEDARDTVAQWPLKCQEKRCDVELE